MSSASAASGSRATSISVTVASGRKRTASASTERVREQAPQNDEETRVSSMRTSAIPGSSSQRSTRSRCSR